MACKILEVNGEKLRVELENGATGIIEKTEFTPRYTRTLWHLLTLR